jgi:hypothetical protein
MIEPGLVSLLNADATLTSMIAGRIYPSILPESPAYPALSYRVISSVPLYDLAGDVISVTTRIEFTTWGTAYADAKTVHQAIRNVIDRFRGTLPGGVNVAFTWRDGASVDDFDHDRRAYNSSVDYKLTHSE